MSAPERSPETASGRERSRGLLRGDWGPLDHRYAPARSWTTLAYPDDPCKTLVDEQGRLLYGFAAPDDDESALHRLSFRQVVAFRIRTSLPLESWSQSLEDAAIPRVRTVLTYPHAQLHLDALAHRSSGGERTDLVQWRILATKDDADVALWAQIQGAAGVRLALRSSAPATRLPLQEPGPGVATELWFAPQPVLPAPAFDFGPAGGAVTEPVTLARGESVEGTVGLLLGSDGGSDIGNDFAVSAAQHRRFWSGHGSGQRSMSLPDPGIQRFVTAAARTIHQLREVKDGVPQYQPGPSIYRGFWVLDGHFLLEAERYLGNDDAARRGLEALRSSLDTETGVVQVLPGHLKEPAVAVATLVRQAELGMELDELDRWWPTIQRTIDHLESLIVSDLSRPITPPAVGDGGLGGLREEYTSVLWWLAGIRAGLRGAGYLGRPTDRLGSLYAALRARALAWAERDAVLTDDGVRFWPMLRPGQGEHPFRPTVDAPLTPWARVTPLTSTYALAQSIYPGEVFGPEERVVTDLLALLASRDGEQGIPSGSGFLPHRALWTYAAPMYAQVALYAGDGHRAVRYLESFCNHASPTFAWREEQSLSTSEVGLQVGDMPHGWAAAELIRLLRHMVVLERGDELEILPGIPAAWFSSGERLHLERSPTRFGRVTVDLSYRSDDDWRLRLEVPSGGPATLARCRVHLPSEGTAQSPVRVDGIPHPGTYLDVAPGSHIVIQRGPYEATSV